MTEPNTHALASVRALARSLDLDAAIPLSATNFHALGLHYVNLFRSDRYTAKLYFALPGEIVHNADGNVVNPHTHGYAFRQTVIRGAVENVVMTVDEPDGPDLWHFADYFSPFKTGGDARLDWHDLPIPMRETVTRYGPGEGYFMDTHHVHTIRIPAGVGPTILFSEQYADEGADSTTFFAREPVDPTYDGLYTSMEAGHACALLDLLPLARLA